MLNAAPPGALRPFAAQTDLGELAELIQVAFGDELRRTGNRMVEDMRQIALLGPLVNLAMSAWPMYNGYVWVHDGHIVGNVSFARELDRGAWQLSNVGVYPEWRGQGIASRLVDAALAHMRAGGAKRVYLQVRHDNQVAQTLYANRGFAVYDTVREWGLRPSAWPLTIGGVTGLQSERWWQSRRLMTLAREALAPGRLIAQPHLLQRYRRGFWQALAEVFELMEGNSAYTACQDGRLVAWGRLKAEGSRQTAELELLVHPHYRGIWETALVSMVLARHYPQRRYVRAHISESHPEGSQALSNLNFELLRVLDEMVLAL